MNNKYPFLLILKGKHGNHYFHITDNESYLDAHVKIFKINQSNGYYHDLGEEFDHGSWIAEKRQTLEKIKSDEILSSQIGLHNINRIERDIEGMEEQQKFQRMYAKCVNVDESFSVGDVVEIVENCITNGRRGTVVEHCMNGKLEVSFDPQWVGWYYPNQLRKIPEVNKKAILDFLYARSSHGYEYEEITEEYYS